MRTVECRTSQQTYPIYIGQQLLESAVLAECLGQRALMIVVDESVPQSFYASLNQLPNPKCWHFLKVSELSKDLSTAQTLWQKLFAQGFDRYSLLVSVGGGVLGDLVGFAASCFMRGIPWLNIPTTLMAQVDAGIGGKTGVNFGQMKNAIGAFHHPEAVFSAPEVLLSLSEVDYRSGLAEVVKYAVAFDGQFLAWIEEHAAGILARDIEVLEMMIFRSSQFKANVVGQDAFDLGPRHSLNLGHTFAHAIESSTEFSLYTHGQAVAIGIMLALELGRLYGGISRQEIDRVSNLLAALGLPVSHPGLTTASIKPYLYKDKKKNGKALCFVVPKRLGEVTIVHDLEETLLDTVINGYA